MNFGQLLLQLGGGCLVLAYIALTGAIGVQAVVYRKPGWITAVCFSLLLISLPLWIGAMYWAFTAWNDAYGQPPPWEAGP